MSVFLLMPCRGSSWNMGKMACCYGPFNLYVRRHLVTVRVGLCHGFSLSLVLLIIFTDRISRCSQVGEGLRFSGLRIPSLPFCR